MIVLNNSLRSISIQCPISPVDAKRISVRQSSERYTLSFSAGKRKTPDNPQDMSVIPSRTEDVDDQLWAKVNNTEERTAEWIKTAIKDGTLSVFQNDGTTPWSPREAKKSGGR